ncbi:hypothetical protein RJ641_021755 [Dillenia turbinata]|uniref:Uncharacterized protein n=1 Tax=Dillenia turbinata TaxID=194707 RepID=A0AAN8UKG5_9MAGN
MVVSGNCIGIRSVCSTGKHPSSPPPIIPPLGFSSNFRYWENILKTTATQCSFDCFILHSSPVNVALHEVTMRWGLSDGNILFFVSHHNEQLFQKLKGHGFSVIALGECKLIFSACVQLFLASSGNNISLLINCYELL